MTERLYYTDPYRTHFTAQVLDRVTWEGHPVLILDRTPFYPTSGGQPADRGTLEATQVLDVVERAADGAILHVLSHPVAKDQVSGRIDWERRFDHMQQHTGQHVLSACFELVLDAETVGFHLGAESSTIDVDLADLQMGQVAPVEALANQVVWDDRSVSTRFVDRETLADLSTAERPPDVEGPIRLVEIPGPSSSSATAEAPPLDVNPCGGTHVTHTGEIGIIKIVGLEHRGDTTRIEFLCGGRALRDYEARRRITDTLASRLTVGTWELDRAVERLQEEIKQLRRDERVLRERLLDMETTQMLGTATPRGPYQVVGAVWRQRSPGELRTLARKLADHDEVVALLFSVPEAVASDQDERVHFCFARAEGLSLDVNRLLQEACARLDGKGGGRPQVAQGSAPDAPMDRVESVLRDLELSMEQRD